jgi:hypothetical protein
MWWKWWKSFLKGWKWFLEVWGMWKRFLEIIFLFWVENCSHFEFFIVRISIIGYSEPCTNKHITHDQVDSFIIFI